MATRILIGDVRVRLAELPDNHFGCVVTSPPYWGLRSYLDADHADKHLEMGLEPTLGEHLDALVSVMREVRRVLHPDGVCWLNYGDCYATSPNGRSAAATKEAGNDDRTFRDKPFSTVGPIRGVPRPTSRPCAATVMWAAVRS
jgi:DNA modification methylase